jgi:hypothetical protein
MKKDTLVQTTRQRVLDFLDSKGGTASCSQIREHLGLDRYQCYGYLDKAYKTVYMFPLYGDGHFATVGKAKLCLRRSPRVGFRLSEKYYNKFKSE